MGVVEQMKGKAKQVAGDLTDNDELHAEGEAQEDKGIEERKETEARAEAKLHEEKADLAERKQQAAESG
ncbi:MAG: hypothetical protein JO246_00445 [Frankiaceae bacterium]|nr:hypothetical protein [Frankiaceae bacterium]MBV9870890.1 hypothetical protein [Frankiaceae bacterium]